MDRNLGASQAATSSTDVNSYGDLYQWGRGSDGHQCRNSATTNTTSSIDQPIHGSFILSLDNWRNPRNQNLWQVDSGVNNPCPSGYRIPTESELENERMSWWPNNNAEGAHASTLKLPMSGYRNGTFGSLVEVGTNGRYWSSTFVSNDSRYLFFNSSNFQIVAHGRQDGFSVRCIKN
jgi:uncharacterized protein (TIGR02145 family)